MDHHRERCEISMDARLKRLERGYIRSLMQETAVEYGVDADELLDDCRRFLALSDAEQDAELAASIAQAEAEGEAEHVRILTAGWEAIKSYR
jgi:hypothetical protein